jgi:hypothetical protein
MIEQPVADPVRLARHWVTAEFVNDGRLPPLWPNLSREEQQRSNAAEELFRELVRRAVGKE